ncbi:hypothetical protein [Sanguibacter sp. 25GB23B1]|uniref:uridine kinase family protein n=1 Tax=unclassified Sanguibacter TaxID=2645534 RepID=UPI0032AEBB2A
MTSPLSLRPEEPAAGPWTPTPLAALIDEVRALGGPPTTRPLVLAIDGRGAGGKSTLADAIHDAVPRSTVVHTDDVAWHEPYFAWQHLLLKNILVPLRDGRPVTYRPPAWASKDREGSITVASGLELVIIEGTGAGDRTFAPFTDALIWVQSDATKAERRGIARDVAAGTNGDHEQAVAFWHDWMRSEIEYLEEQRPWDRADLFVNGTPERTAGNGTFWTAPRAT